MHGTGSRVKRERGRPRVEDPKMKLDNVRLNMSTLTELELVIESLSVSKSEFVSALIEKELGEYKDLLCLQY